MAKKKKQAEADLPADVMAEEPAPEVVESTPDPEPVIAPPPPRVRIPKPRFEDGPWVALANGGVYGGAPVVGATEALRAAKHTLQGGARVVAIVSGDPAIVPEDLRERLIAVLAEIAGRR